MLVLMPLLLRVLPLKGGRPWSRGRRLRPCLLLAPLLRAPLLLHRLLEPLSLGLRPTAARVAAGDDHNHR